MAKYCTYIPSKGQALFMQLKKEFGYQTAKDIFLRAINPDFINDFKGTLSLDAEGVPSYSSLMKNSYMKKHIGKKKMSDALSSRFNVLDDTIDNFNHQLEVAFQFNTQDDAKSDYIAVVRSDNNKVRVVVEPKTDSNMKEFKDQYGSYKLNQRLADMFNPLGVTVGRLTLAEQGAGRIGVTDFSKAKDMANGFATMIRVANNMEGGTALTEEFSHLIIGIMRDEPLVVRSINLLQDRPESLRKILGDDYDDVVKFYEGDMSKVAEEAAGHVLQKNLVRNSELNEVPNKTIFRRMIDYILRKFRNFNASDVDRAISDVDNYMSNIARDIINGSRQFTREDIRKSQRDVQFNALSDRVQRNIDILKEAARVEAKRGKIGSVDKDFASNMVSDILASAKPNADTVLGLMNYANSAVQQLRGLEDQFDFFDSMNFDQKFGFLRATKAYLQSYGSFINAMQDAITEERQEKDNMFASKFEINGEEIDIPTIISDLNNLVSNLGRRYANKAMPAFAQFLKPFLGDEIVVPYGRNAGKKITVEDLIRQADKDISFTDRWLDSMADSSDVLLQLFDAVVKKAHDVARLNTIDEIREIQALRQKAESYGITDFEWMFEKDSNGHKSGNYISEVNEGQFETDRKELEKELDEKYGVNPTGEDAKAKIAERNEWYSTHALQIFGNAMADPQVYHNVDFDNLTDNQREIYDEFMKLKNKYDDYLPDNRVTKNKAIQQRKNSSQRVLNSITNPSTLISNLKGAIATELLESEDDDRIFGDTISRKGMTDFNGNEFNTLPVLYTNRLKNPDELSTDVFASLMSYAFMANNYREMDKVIDPLEVGRTLVKEQRKFEENRGGRKVKERFSFAGVDVVNPIYKSKSNIEAKLDDFFASQVYGKYLKDQGTWDIFGHQVNKNKLVSYILKNSSMAQLGFNFLANLANLSTGVGMQNIEAASHQFFTPKQLASADAAYASCMTSFLPEIGARVKTNKLSLFDDLFDIKNTFGSRVKHNQKKNLFQRIFGSNIAFIGQDSGDHWLYNRTAIAMAKNEEVYVDGENTNLWDALQVEKDDNGIAYLNYKKIKDADGNQFDVAAFGRKVTHVNQTLFGIYNEEDQNAASRVAVGRLLQQYRKWMKVQMNRRFQPLQYNLATNTWEEGYYVTMGRILNELVRGKVQIGQIWDELTEPEKANLKRGIVEILQFAAVWCLANLIEWPDDKKRPWLVKLAEYSSKRAAHELGGLTPSFVFLRENLKTIKTPIPAISVVQNSVELLSSCVDPTDWFDEIQTGPYKGMSTLEKNFIKAPIPGVAQFRQVQKFTGDLDNSIQYYMRPSN